MYKQRLGFLFEDLLFFFLCSKIIGSRPKKSKGEKYKQIKLPKLKEYPFIYIKFDINSKNIMIRSNYSLYNYLQSFSFLLHQSISRDWGQLFPLGILIVFRQNNRQVLVTIQGLCHRYNRPFYRLLIRSHQVYGK
ncbi:hypothetical protein HR11_01145 [Porphyromonas macacae]|nr:hypothetical protein HR11_01145 [Porphyromonas macacae]